MELIIFLGTLFVFLFLNIPIALVMVLSAICLMIYSGMWDFMIIPQAMVDGVNNYPLMAIPFFVFAGEIMSTGGLSKRVVLRAQLLIGRVKGGLGYATIGAAVIFFLSLANGKLELHKLLLSIQPNRDQSQALGTVFPYERADFSLAQKKLSWPGIFVFGIAVSLLVTGDQGVCEVEFVAFDGYIGSF